MQWNNDMFKDSYLEKQKVQEFLVYQKKKLVFNIQFLATNGVKSDADGASCPDHP